MSTTYEPNRLNVGIILAPDVTVAPVLERELGRVIKSQPVHSAREVIDWARFFEHDGALYDVRRLQMALLAPREGLTVFTCNLADGWVSLYSNLVKVGTFDAYFFSATLAEKVKYRVFEMQAWVRGARLRHLRALEDESGWTFLDEGEALSFESPMQYKKREVGARLDRRLIELYSEAAGYRMSAVTRFAGESWRYWRAA
jgi:hypothetical protein